MTASQTYLIGFVVVIVGLAIAAYLMAVPPVWIAVGVIVLVGIAIMAAASRSDTPSDGY
jgi:urea transporter